MWINFVQKIKFAFALIYLQLIPKKNNNILNNFEPLFPPHNNSYFSEIFTYVPS